MLFHPIRQQKEKKKTSSSATGEESFLIIWQVFNEHLGGKTQELVDENQKVN